MRLYPDLKTLKLKRLSCSLICRQRCRMEKHTYTTTIDVGADRELWVAVGISVRWETYLTYYMDYVEIEISEPFA